MFLLDRVVDDEKTLGYGRKVSSSRSQRGGDWEGEGAGGGGEGETERENHSRSPLLPHTCHSERTFVNVLCWGVFNVMWSNSTSRGTETRVQTIPFVCLLHVTCALLQFLQWPWRTGSVFSSISQVREWRFT